MESVSTSQRQRQYMDDAAGRVQSRNSWAQAFLASLLLACALMASYLVFPQHASSSALSDEAKVVALTGNGDNVAADDNAIIIRLSREHSDTEPVGTQRLF